MFSKTNLIYLGLFLAGFAVINTGVYFFLHTTQPKTAVLLTAGETHGSGADSMAGAEHHADEIAAPVTEPVPPESIADVRPEPVTPSAQQTSVAAATEHTPQTAHAESVPPSTADATVEPAVAETLTDLQASDESAVESADTTGAAESLAADQQKLAKLAKLLESMKPDEAAAIASELPADVIVQLVLRMKDRSAAKMMAALPVEMASQVADLMSQVATRTQGAK